MLAGSGPRSEEEEEREERLLMQNIVDKEQKSVKVRRSQNRRAARVRYFAPIRVTLKTAVLRKRMEIPVGSTPYFTPYQKVPADNVLTAHEHGMIFDINTWGWSFTRCSRVILVVEQLEHSNNDATVTGAALSTETAVWNPTLTALLTGAASVNSVYSGLQTMETESIRYV